MAILVLLVLLITGCLAVVQAQPAPENLGLAINGSMNDEFFSIVRGSNHAIFSKQVNVQGTDPYHVSMEELFGQPRTEKRIDSRDASDEAIRDRFTTWEDSLAKLKSRKRPIYRGFDVSFGSPKHTVKSNISKINGMPVGYFGGMAAGVIGNPAGKIRGGIGFYYSNDNVPISFDLVTANLTASVYLLRMAKIEYHTIEPYLFVALSQTRNKFYGHYTENTRPKNYSSSEESFIGGVNSSQFLIGTGIEYQLEDDANHFIHLYVEVSYGTSVKNSATAEVLSNTSVSNTLWITLGVSFGKFN